MRKLLLLTLLLLTGCTQAPGQSISAPANLPDLGEAPELINDIWLNTDAPMRLADLRGKVVLLDMWTFG